MALVAVKNSSVLVFCFFSGFSTCFSSINFHCMFQLVLASAVETEGEVCLGPGCGATVAWDSESTLWYVGIRVHTGCEGLLSGNHGYCQWLVDSLGNLGSPQE